MDTIYENVILNNIVTLCKSHSTKVSPSKMCVDLGISKSLITKLKSNPSRSLNGETAQKIAEYFGVSVDRVLGSDQKEKSPAPEGVELDEDTLELLEIWRTGDVSDREFLLANARMLKARRK